MTLAAMLDYMDAFQLVRGWRPRRVYLTANERAALLMAQPRNISLPGEFLMFDGAAMRHVSSYDVALRIREWDLCPGSE